MPLLKKIVVHGGSRGVNLPASWLTLIEKETGQKLREVLMEVNGEITIRPLIEKKLGQRLGAETSC
jgi:antitoxin component of MazEF toxin-antitoxin module